MEVEPTEPHSCGACGMRVRDTIRNKARWYKYSGPTGWCEWGQCCGPCLYEKWRSMERSWDSDINDDSDYSHGAWEKRLFEEVIRRRLQGPQPAGIEEELRDPEQYELKSPVVPDESDDEWE